MKVVLGSDHGGFALKEIIKKYLEEKNFEIIDKGCHSKESVDYPVYAQAVAKDILDNSAEFGILICGTGIGISISANRFKGIRAALCTNTTMAKLAREHNNANILVLGARMIGDVLALEIVDEFMKTEFLYGRHKTRIDLIETI